MNDLDFGAVARALPLLPEGLGSTLKLTVVASARGLFFGTLLALARLEPKPLAVVAGTYVNLMRAVPLLLVIFWSI